MSQRYRDARGRFRKPTDEERWPDPVERARAQSIRALLTPPPWMVRHMAELLAANIRNIDLVALKRAK